MSPTKTGFLLGVTFAANLGLGVAYGPEIRAAVASLLPLGAEPGDATLSGGDHAPRGGTPDMPVIHFANRANEQRAGDAPQPSAINDGGRQPSMPHPASSGANVRANGATVSTEVIEETIRSYLLREPEILERAIQELQSRKIAEQQRVAEQAISTRRAELFENASLPGEGPASASVELVEFLDYNCGYCKQAAGDVARLAREGIRVQHRHVGILGPGSQIAARAALAAASVAPDGYEAFHRALIDNRGQIDDAAVRQAAGVAGIDWAVLSAAMENPTIARQLEANTRLMAEIGARGTPAFVTKKALIPGALGYQAMRQAVEAARR